MRVDWHTHVWRPEHLGPVWGPELDDNVGSHPSEDGSPERHLHAMDEAGIERAVVVGLVACDINLEIPNAFISEYVASAPERLIGFGSVDPSDPQASAKVREAAEEFGLRGIKLSPPYQGFHPHSEEAWSVYTAAANNGLALMFHQGGVFLKSGMLEYAQPVLLDRVARSFPQTPIIIAHAGQPWAHETVAVMFKNPNVFTDLSARYGRPAQLRSIIRGFIDYGVESRVLFGSDFPIYRPLVCIEQLESIASHDPEGIPPDVLEDIVNNRPLELLDRIVN